MSPEEKKLIMPVFPRLTDKQLECLRLVFNFYSTHLHYPSRREIAQTLNISAQAAHYQVEALIKKGYLLRVEGETRNIRVNPDSEMILRHLGIIKPEGGNDEKA
jgi:SOS-response transcriptional repressor LexA